MYFALHGSNIIPWLSSYLFAQNFAWQSVCCASFSLLHSCIVFHCVSILPGYSWAFGLPLLSPFFTCIISFHLTMTSSRRHFNNPHYPGENTFDLQHFGHLLWLGNSDTGIWTHNLFMKKSEFITTSPSVSTWRLLTQWYPDPDLRYGCAASKLSLSLRTAWVSAKWCWL